jgi:hypothetical protein
MKIIINKCHGSFRLSKAACKLYQERTGKKISSFPHTTCRDDPDLVYVVEKLGKKASGSFADLHIVDIPDDVQWIVEELDGREWISEVHRIWS